MSDAGADPDARYFQAVEEFFVERRGDPLFLSNADWFLVWKWRRAGVPLRVVLRGIADALESHAASWGRRRRVSSLAYCRSEVEAAAQRWRDRLAPEAGEGRASAGALLLGLADALAGAALGPLAAAQAARLAGALRERAEGARRGPGLDRWLARGERALVEALLEGATPAERDALESEIAAGLARYRERLPERVLEQVREEARARRVLEAHGLPRLSLFHEARDG